MIISPLLQCEDCGVCVCVFVDLWMDYVFPGRMDVWAFIWLGRWALDGPDQIRVYIYTYIHASRAPEAYRALVDEWGGVDEYECDDVDKMTVWEGDAEAVRLERVSVRVRSRSRRTFFFLKKRKHMYLQTRRKRAGITHSTTRSMPFQQDRISWNLLSMLIRTCTHMSFGCGRP